MKCPYCDEKNTKVVDSREADGKVRRRRECSECERRFTTYETAEKLDVQVVKENGSTEAFDEEKIRNGIQKAVQKTAVTDEEVEETVEKVKKRVIDKQEIHTDEIGQAVKDELKKLDEVAYIRFASVCDSYDDVESFKKEVESLKKIKE